MSGFALYRDPVVSRGRAADWLFKKIPVWPIVVFSAVIAAAYSPNVLQVFNILDDYDSLTRGSKHFFFHLEAEHLFAVARPVAALFTNLPLLLVQSADDFRWVRIFTLLTACVLGTQMIANCIVRLRTRALDAVAVALATFLGLAFIYAILDASAWAPHLLTPFIALCAYTILGRSNIQSIPFLDIAKRRDYRALWRQIMRYFCVSSVWSGCLVYQLALYSYPPYALILTAFPVIGILFSQAPRAYRTLLALRDVAFIGVNLVLYFLSAKLLYLPFVRIFTKMGTDAPDSYENAWVAAAYASYRFKTNTDLSEIWRRLKHLMVVSGDLWFLPQTRMHILTAAVLLLAFFAANGTALLARRDARFRAVQENTIMARLSCRSWASDGAVVVLVLAVCYVMAALPVLASAGGFIAYRTSVAPVAIAAIVFVFVVRAIAETIWTVVRQPLITAANAGGFAAVLTICAAFAACFDANRAMMTLGRNEFAYISGVVQQAIDNRSKAIFLIEPRSPEGDLFPRTVYDQRGRAVPPYELACFASYCNVQTGAIVRVAAAQFGLSYDAFEILTPRGDEPVPGLTCEMLTTASPSYPPNATERSIAIINQYRAMTPLTCEMASLVWHDLGVDLRR